MVERVFLAGAGNIGIRHLQGLGRYPRPLEVDIFDLNAESLGRAAEAASEFGNIVHNTASEIPSAYADIAILATPSAGRLQLLSDVCSHVNPQGIILEKVVFQSAADFAEAGTLLKQRGTPAWVNCPRRLWPLYRDMKSALRDDRPFCIFFEGKSLGLACNSVHFIDLMQFLLDDDSLSLEDQKIDRIFPSRRPGFYECFGSITIMSRAGHRLILESRESSPEQNTSRFSYQGEGEGILFSELEGVFENPGEGIALQHGRPPYQSELSGLVVEELIGSGTCALPTFAESERSHLLLFEALENDFRKAGLVSEHGLPIT
ncbi:MAG: hypothetical protein WDZ83_09045 [Rhizobiaceae bacterium]